MTRLRSDEETISCIVYLGGHSLYGRPRASKNSVDMIDTF
jgi:hypothetical protein